MLDKIRRMEYLEYIGLGVALIGLLKWVILSAFSVFALFFGPIIMCGTTLLMFPYGLASVVLGWLSRERNALVAWITIAIGVFLPLASVGLLFVLGEIVGATAY